SAQWTVKREVRRRCRRLRRAAGSGACRRRGFQADRRAARRRALRRLHFQRCRVRRAVAPKLDRHGRPGFDPARRRGVDSAMSWGAAIDEWADKNLTVTFAAQTQSAVADAKQARASGLHALDSAARANAE